MMVSEPAFGDTRAASLWDACCGTVFSLWSICVRADRDLTREVVDAASGKLGVSGQ
jgi:hypothetical protein